jgi:hypothetical protein
MSKQTSVDFLTEELSAIIGKINFTAMQGLLMKDAIEKAKEMEKEQIKEAFKEGNLYHGWALKHEPEQYYNETYKKDK